MANKQYERVNWAAYPNKSTPMTAENLNRMDKGIDNLDTRTTNLENRQDNYESDMTDVKSDVLELTDSLSGLGECVVLASPTSNGNVTIPNINQFKWIYIKNGYLDQNIIYGSSVIPVEVFKMKEQHYISYIHSGSSYNWTSRIILTLVDDETISVDLGSVPQYIRPVIYGIK